MPASTDARFAGGVWSPVSANDLRHSEVLKCRWFRQRDVNGRRLEEFVLSETVVNDLVGQQKRSDLEKLVRMQV